MANKIVNTNDSLQIRSPCEAFGAEPFFYGRARRWLIIAPLSYFLGVGHIVYFGGSISWIPSRDIVSIINMMVIAFSGVKKKTWGVLGSCIGAIKIMKILVSRILSDQSMLQFLPMRIQTSYRSSCYS